MIPELPWSSWRREPFVTWDQGPCFRTWTPRTCRAWGQRSPVDHTCWTSRVFPHVCICRRCGH